MSVVYYISDIIYYIIKGHSMYDLLQIYSIFILRISHYLEKKIFHIIYD